MELLWEAFLHLNLGIPNLRVLFKPALKLTAGRLGEDLQMATKITPFPETTEHLRTHTLLSRPLSIKVPCKQKGPEMQEWMILSLHHQLAFLYLCPSN